MPEPGNSGSGQMCGGTCSGGSLAGSGLSWGLFSALTSYLYTAAAAETVAVTLCVTAFGIGGMAVLAPQLWTQRLYLLAMLGPLCLTDVFHSEHVQYRLAQVRGWETRF